MEESMLLCSITPKTPPVHVGPLRMRTSSTPNGDGTVEMLKQSIVTDRETAEMALRKLRKRQMSELEETERLLELVTNDGTGTVAQPSLSTAASILSGADYGFVSRSEGPPATLKGALATMSVNYGPPSNVWSLGSQQFIRNWRAMQGEYLDEPKVNLTPHQIELQAKLVKLKLNSTAIWERENADGPIDAPWIIKLPYLAVCYLLDVLFEKSYVPARFFLLETVARMPYFSYISMLHLYETLGFWRRSADAKRIHFAEELNEYAHLMIMESLGGDQKWWVRFVAQHSAIVYYFVLCGLFAISPTLSYRFSELLETHAVNTYSVFLENNEDLLKKLPPTNAAVNYYALGTSDPFYAEFQTASIVGHEIRRPGEHMQNLYQVFQAICADERDHVCAMEACLDSETSIRSPSIERRFVTGIAALVVASYLISTTGIIDATGLLDSTNVVGDTTAATSTADAAVADVIAAGLAGLAQRVAQDGQTGNLKDLGADMVESGARTVLEPLRRFAAVLAKFVSRLL